MVALPILLCSIVLAQPAAPKVIAWQAPSGPSVTGCLAPYNSGFWGDFTSTVLPKVSGIGVTIRWNCIDNCTSATDLPCATPTTPCAGHSTADWEECFNWADIDSDLTDYLHGTDFKSKKIVLIVRAESDSGGVNNATPQYVFHSTYPGPQSWPLQDVSVCPDWPGDLAVVSGRFTDMHNDFAIWNQSGCEKVLGSTLSCSCTGPGCGFTDFSGFPVVYEKPIKNAFQNFLLAFFRHYSVQGGSSGPEIAPYILYARIGLSHGGENYPICSTRGALPSCQNPPCSTGNANSMWPGPQGQFSPTENWMTQFAYSDAGYLTSWPVDGTGYTTEMLQFLKQNATFPVTTASSYGPPNKNSQLYADLEAQFAQENNVGFGNQILNVADTVLAAAGMPSFDNWVANFKNYPDAPVHHLQTQAPGNNGLASGFSIDHIDVLAGTATVTCAGGASCGTYCPAVVYIVGSGSPGLNGIFQTGTALQCGTANVVYTPTQHVDDGPYYGGIMWGPNYWPITMPFATQQGATAIEVWECDIDFAYGTTTTAGCNTTLTPTNDYMNAVGDMLLGLPAWTSFHTDTLFNGRLY